MEFFISIVYTILIYRQDWEEKVKESEIRRKNDEEQNKKIGQTNEDGEANRQKFSVSEDDKDNQFKKMSE